MVLDANSRISLSNNDSGAGNTIFGYLAGAAIAGGGNSNLLIGHEAGNDLTTADGNVVIGYQALNQATDDCDQNVVVGNYSMGGNITSNDVSNCVALGYNVLSGVLTSTATGTVAIGASALSSLTSGAGNTAVGYQCLDGTDDGAVNTAVGYGSLSADCGNGNTVLGYLAGADVTGALNTLIGHQAGKDTVALTSGTSNICIGNNSRTSAADSTNQIVIGDDTGGVADNSVTLGNASVTAVYMASDSGAIVHTAGIQFPATQVANAGANVLDDYEEGTWTPAISGATTAGSTSAGTFVGTYTKIGRIVTAHFSCTAYTLGSAAGYLQITGFPFTAQGANNRGQVGTVKMYNTDLSAPSAGFFIPTIEIADNGTTSIFVQTKDNGVWDVVAVENSSDLYVEGVITYST